MFFGFTNSSLAGSGLSNLTFASRRIGRDRRGVVREMEGRMVALDRAQALVELGLDCRILDANALFVALLGTTSDAILGQPYTALLTEAERAGPVFRQLQDRLSRSESASARLQHVTRDNGALELRITFMPVTGDDGKVARPVRDRHRRNRNRTERAPTQRDRPGTVGDRTRYGRENPDREQEFSGRGRLRLGGSPRPAPQHVR